MPRCSCGADLIGHTLVKGCAWAIDLVEIDKLEKEIKRLRGCLKFFADGRPNHGAIWGDDNAALERCGCHACEAQLALNGQVFE